MSYDMIFNIILVVLATILLLTYSIYVIIDERKRKKHRKYYNGEIIYEIDYTMYNDMVCRQKIIILKKYIQLFFLTILVKIKELFKWNKK